MVAPDYNSLCRYAELYYYDFLCDESHGLIPESVLNHIEQCRHCQEQINQLEKVLSQAEGQVESQQRQNRIAVTEMLKLHLAYVGKRVTCQAVRPFLPVSLDADLEIKIPTPITAHLDNCQQCREDLETIRELNLNRKQLWRLGQLLADRSVEDVVSCLTARSAIPSVVVMDWSGITAERLKHLCKCTVCRGLLYEERQKLCDSLPKPEESGEFSCESVSATDIFDYCLPYGIDPAGDEYEKFRPALTSHLRTCRNCLAKMQELHKTICAIVERPESGVATIYHIDESAKVEAIGESDNPYAGLPVRVEIAGREEQVKDGPSVPIVKFGAALKRKVSAMNLKPLLKPAIAAAAIILIGVALFFSTPAASAVTIERIYKAVEKIKNVYIASFFLDKKEPIQERWVSRAANSYMTKTGSQLVLWDIPNRIRKTKNLDTAVSETIRLTDDTLVGIKSKISGSLGIMPFYAISDIPADAQWSRMTDEGLEAAAEGIEVYDLTWVEKAHDGSDIFCKWRVFVDPETNLPQRTELYRKLAADDEYTLRLVKVVEYLSNSEIEAAIKEASF